MRRMMLSGFLEFRVRRRRVLKPSIRVAQQELVEGYRSKQSATGQLVSNN